MKPQDENEINKKEERKMNSNLEIIDEENISEIKLKIFEEVGVKFSTILKYLQFGR